MLTNERRRGVLAGVCPPIASELMQVMKARTREDFEEGSRFPNAGYGMSFHNIYVQEKATM